MKKKVLVTLGILATLVLAFLWYKGYIDEPLYTIGALIVTLFIQFFISEDTDNTKIINQKHSGNGDNVAGDKIVNNKK